MSFSSVLLENAIDEIANLPSIGRRTATRLALHLLKQPVNRTEALSEALMVLRNNIQYCTSCHNISDMPICQICEDTRRDHNLICVVEDIRDVMAIENTHQYKGIYHVLGGKISPMEGISPHQLMINSLIEKCTQSNISELIFAMSATMEGDTTNLYIYKQIEHLNIRTSNISRGMAVGSEIEYTDELTLGKSIINRVPFKQSINTN